MKYCTNCGKGLQDDMQFCPSCGTPVQMSLNNSVPEETTKIEEPPKKKSKILPVIIILAIIVALVLIASSLLGSNVQYIDDRSVQYDENTNSMILFFSFKDKNRKRISSDAELHIRIEDEKGNSIYSATKNVTKQDFGYWTSPLMGEQYLCSIKIPISDIKKGTSSSGKLFFTAEKSNRFIFDESVVDIINGLPVDLPTFEFLDLPKEVSEESSYFGVQGTLIITDATVEYSEYSETSATILLSGEKTFGSGYCQFVYKVLDANGYTISSGTVMTDNISAGEKFKNETIHLYDLEPGQKYTVSFSSYLY